jgi:acyl carrier protein
MNETLRARILRVLAGVAPDIDAATLDADAPIRDQYDFDSVDTLNFAIALKQEFGVDVPEADFAQLAALARCESYLVRRLAAAAPGGR